MRPKTVVCLQFTLEFFSVITTATKVMSLGLKIVLPSIFEYVKKLLHNSFRGYLGPAGGEQAR